MTTIIQAIAQSVDARINCIDRNLLPGVGINENKIEELIEQLPFGGGIDYGVEIDYERSNSDRIVINSTYHVMNDDGYYTGLINYRVIITASLLFGIDVNVVGNFSSNMSARGVKEYLIDLYNNALLEKVIK